MQKHSLFSYNLIQETINVFQEEDGILLSETEAIEILSSLAGLYLAFAREGKATPARLQAAGSPDLINPHSC